MVEKGMCPICKSRPALKPPSNIEGYCSRICHEIEFTLAQGRLIDDAEFLKMVADIRHLQQEIGEIK